MSVMNEEEARVEHARLLAVAGDWARRCQSSPSNMFTQMQYELAKDRADKFAEDVLVKVAS